MTSIEKVKEVQEFLFGRQKPFAAAFRNIFGGRLFWLLPPVASAFSTGGGFLVSAVRRYEEKGFLFQNRVFSTLVFKLTSNKRNEFGAQF